MTVHRKATELPNYRTTNFKVKRGFTLIELLVVIAIIGILASFGVASFNSAQQKGRDSRRKSDLDAIKKALELAKTDSVGSSYYPACPVGSPNGMCLLNSTNQTVEPQISPTYIKTVTSDPKGGADCSPTNGWQYGYCYLPAPQSCDNTATNCTRFQITACMENANEPTSNIVFFAPAGLCSSQRQLRVANP